MSNDQALSQYSVSKYRTPDGYTSDIAVFTIVKESKAQLKLLLIQRAMRTRDGKVNIEAGKWALPGGFVQENESAYTAAGRELAEETNVTRIHLKHFGVYDEPGRDPRGWIISNAHYAIVNEEALRKRFASDDASEVELFSLGELQQLDLAFDHSEIISDAISMITKDLLQTTTAKNFLPKTFTYSELQSVLLTVTDDRAIASGPSFSRKIKSLPFIKAVEGQKTTRTSKRPTQLYQFVDIEVNHSIY